MGLNVDNAGFEALYTALNASFTSAFGEAPSDWRRVAMPVPSSTSENLYPWLRGLPGLREWIGDRVIHALEREGYRLANRDFEDSFGVDINSMDDDTYGTYATNARLLGNAIAIFPDQLVFEALVGGFAAPCWDGKAFFAPDHPVLNGKGGVTTFSNLGAGSGNPWFLIDTRRGMLPLIYQLRKQGMFDQLSTVEDAKRTRKMLYGTHHRCAVGYGFPQVCFGSKATLDADAYAAARAKMRAYTKDGGAKIGVVPNLLVVGSSNEQAALKILNAEQINNETNVWRGTAELLVTSWLN